MSKQETLTNFLKEYLNFLHSFFFLQQENRSFNYYQGFHDFAINIYMLMTYLKISKKDYDYSNFLSIKKEREKIAYMTIQRISEFYIKPLAEIDFKDLLTIQYKVLVEISRKLLGKKNLTITRNDLISTIELNICFYSRHMNCNDFLNFVSFMLNYDCKMILTFTALVIAHITDNFNKKGLIIDYNDDMKLGIINDSEENEFCIISYIQEYDFKSINYDLIYCKIEENLHEIEKIHLNNSIYKCEESEIISQKYSSTNSGLISRNLNEVLYIDNNNFYSSIIENYFGFRLKFLVYKYSWILIALVLLILMIIMVNLLEIEINFNFLEKINSYGIMEKITNLFFNSRTKLTQDKDLFQTYKDNSEKIDSYESVYNDKRYYFK